jgi:hypothetical protein
MTRFNLSLVGILAALGASFPKVRGSQGNRYTPLKRATSERDAWNERIAQEKLEKHRAKLARKAAK